MELQSDYEVKCEKYLLGELSESDSQQLEEAYFADDSLFERFVAVKEDLVDAYARGTLKGKKRDHFEKQFLGNTARREKIEDARQLIRLTTAASRDIASQKTSTARSDERPSFWSWLTGGSVLIPASALAILLIAAFVGWMLLRERSNRIQPNNGQAKQSTEPGKESSAGDQRATIQKSPQISPSESGNPAEKKTDSEGHRRVAAPARENSTSSRPTETVALVLTPLISRSAQTPDRSSLTLDSNVKAVQLRLALPRAVEGRVDISIRDLEGREVASGRGLKTTSETGGTTATFTFPASRLKRQDHIVRLSTRSKNETIAEYYFTVVRKPPR